MNKNTQPSVGTDVHFAMSEVDREPIPTEAYVREPGEVSGIGYPYAVVKFGPVTFFGRPETMARALANASDQLRSAIDARNMERLVPGLASER